MKRFVSIPVLALSLIAFSAPPAGADVRTRDRGHVKLEGVLGAAFNLFGGKAAREGVVSINAVKGDRKVTMNESNGRIVDLREEKIYEIDVKKKTYTVKTFAEKREEMRQAAEEAERESRKSQGGEQKGEAEKGKEVEVDFDVKETGQKKSIAGYDTRQVIMTITVREKGKTLEESGGIVLTADSWLGPEIPQMKELAEFEVRYWQAIAPEASGVSPEQMAAILARYPMVKNAMERMQKEKVRLQGTPLATVTTFEGVKSKEQMAQAQQQNQGGGVGGMLARRMKKNDDKPRATLFTITHETLEVATTVPPAELEIPAGFTEKKK